jgi:hypothetical protein
VYRFRIERRNWFFKPFLEFVIHTNENLHDDHITGKSMKTISKQ